MDDGTEPIEDDERLYRRIILEHYDPEKGNEPSPKAFRPRKDDITGISVFRAKYTTPEEVATTNRGKCYWVAVLRAGDLRNYSLAVVPKPENNQPGHAEIPDLTYENRRDDAAEETQQLLAQKLCLKILGPLP